MVFESNLNFFAFTGRGVAIEGDLVKRVFDWLHSYKGNLLLVINEASGPGSCAYASLASPNQQSCRCIRSKGRFNITIILIAFYLMITLYAKHEYTIKINNKYTKNTCTPAHNTPTNTNTNKTETLKKIQTFEKTVNKKINKCKHIRFPLSIPPYFSIQFYVIEISFSRCMDFVSTYIK